MKRYVSLAGALVLGSVLAHKEKKHFKTDIAVQAQPAFELEHVAVLEGTRVPHDVMERRSKKSPRVERQTSQYSESNHIVERQTSHYTENTPDVER
jgi:hypothetical protein